MQRHHFKMEVMKYNIRREANLEEYIREAERELLQYQYWLEGIIRLCLTGK